MEQDEDELMSLVGHQNGFLDHSGVGGVGD